MFFKKSSIPIRSIYRIKSTYCKVSSYSNDREWRFIIQRRLNFFFFKVWIKEIDNWWHSTAKAEAYLKDYIETKHFKKYFAVTDNSVIDGSTIVEVQKKTKLKAFL